MDARSASFAPRSSGAPARLRFGRDEAWVAIAGPGLIFAGHILFGAMLPQTALILTAIAAALVGVCLLRPKLRRELERLDGLALPAALLGVVIFVALWSLTPLAPGGPHPVWAYLHISPGAATIDKSATLLETIKLLGLGCFFVLGLAAATDDRRARLALNALLALAAAFGAWAFLRFVAGTQPSGNGRLQANFLNSNAAGTVFATCFVLAAGPLVRAVSGAKGRRLAPAALWGAAAILFLACVFAAASRGAFMAIFVGLAVLGALMVFSGRLKWSRALLFGTAVALLVAVLLATAGAFLLNRIISATPEIDARSFITKIHWQAFLVSPLFGYGLGTFDTVNRMLLNAATFRRLWDIRAAHDVYLGWLEEAGLAGALPMFACVGALVVTSVRKSLRRSRMVPVIFALIAADFVFMAHGAVDFALQMFSISAMWAWLLGLQFAVAQGSSTR